MQNVPLNRTKNVPTAIIHGVFEYGVVNGCAFFVQGNIHASRGKCVQPDADAFDGRTILENALLWGRADDVFFASARP